MNIAIAKQRFKSYQKVIFNSFWIIFDKVIRMAGGLFIGIWFARYLGPFEFGVWNYAFSIISMTIPFINLGLNNVLLTDLIRKEEKGKILFNALLIKLFTGTVATLSIIVFAQLLGKEPLTRVLLIILSFQCILFVSDVFDIFYQSRTESRLTVIVKSSAYLLFSIFKVFALLGNYGVVFFAYITVLELLVVFVLLLVFYFNVSKQKLHHWRPDWVLIKDLVRRALPFMAAEILITIYTRIDQVMLKNMVGNVELGKYSAAVRMSEIWYFIGSAISVSFYPTLIQLKEKGPQAYLEGFRKLFGVLSAIAILLSVLITFTANPIVHFLYGSEFEGAGLVLSIHIWTGVFVYLGVAASNWFMIEQKQSLLLVRTAAGAVMNVLLNLLLIPYFGGAGAAIATLIAQIFASFLMNAFSAQTLPIFKLQLGSLLVYKLVAKYRS
ncbi:flippase [Pseudocnuella soli]|uniref:flippase n=1 Tax=Pseudocnuella soli TaxID=2502779 RepID=UPI00104B97C9|nr:flippase [Pseudocnuella soli]